MLMTQNTVVQDIQNTGKIKSAKLINTSNTSFFHQTLLIITEKQNKRSSPFTFKYVKISFNINTQRL